MLPLASSFHPALVRKKLFLKFIIQVKAFDAHTDYIRCLEVHPTLPYVISSADDMSIKLWDWDRNWTNIQQFDGHAHYVMMVRINPKDTNTFASASLDRSIKVCRHTSSSFRLDCLVKNEPTLCLGVDARLISSQLFARGAREGRKLLRLLPRWRQAVTALRC